MSKPFDETVKFDVKTEVEVPQPEDILVKVHMALKEKGYNPINQIVGYLLSGDPAYITSHNNARNLISGLERDDIVKVLLTSYLK